MDKRTFLKSVLLSGVGVYAAGSHSILKAARSHNGRIGMFPLPLLNYDYSSVEPFMDAGAMKIHYEQIHGSITDQLNTAVNKTGLSGKSTKVILEHASGYDNEITRNAGGYLNHKIFWTMLGPSSLKSPSGELKTAIIRDFGSVKSFQLSFAEAVHSVNGSGWAWLMSDRLGRLEIMTTINDEFPLQKGKIPVICLDLWEHAYINRHENKTSYLNAFWDALNWDCVSHRYKVSKKMKIS